MGSTHTVADVWRSSFLQVSTADGRLISGILTCLDKQGNIVLQHAAQHLESSREERHLGTVIVPRGQRTKTQAMVRHAWPHSLACECACVPVRRNPYPSSSPTCRS